MHLKHITISGFKSFAKKSELEFSAPITSIVGPNGSGKSNIAEAFRFVLGEQSSKGMRAKKGADLIFNGSDSLSRENRASVSIVLNNTKRVFPIDFDEIILERTVYRDGQNEYLINNSKVRLKDVQELLSAANIGPTGHHIISQGESDRILSASPKERREMIEDALGLKIFQYKKKEAEKKLAKTSKNIWDVQQLRREVAPHLKFLERQVKKIERAIKLRENLTSIYSEYLKREDIYLAHHFDRLTLLKHEPAKRISVLEKQLSEAKRTLSSHNENKNADEFISVEEEIASIQTKHQTLLRKIGHIEGQISFLQRRIDQSNLKSSLEKESPVDMSELKFFFSAVEKTINKAVKNDKVAQLKRSLLDVVYIFGKFIQDSSGTITIDTTSEKTELAEREKDLNSIEKDVEEVKNLEKNAVGRHEEMKKSIKDGTDKSLQAEREVFRISAEQRDEKDSLTKIENELISLETDRMEFKRELQEAVSLIGRNTASYLNFEIIFNGDVVDNKDIAEESRDIQRERRRELEKMKIRLEELGGANDDIEKEYKEVKERDEFLVHEIEDLNLSVLKLQELITGLDKQLNEQFILGIDKIGAEFNRFFTLMFGGGEAKLFCVKIQTRKKEGSTEEMTELENSQEENIAQGVDLDVKLPNKRVRGLNMLSGGERALTSIALIFAMSQVNPPIFIILDETDAALDEANSRRYGDMIQALSTKSQLILITHNRETMSRAGILYGVTMSGDGVSKLLSVKFDEAIAVLE